MHRTSSARVVPRRAGRSLCALLSVAALGCTASAEAPETRAPAPSAAGQGLHQTGVDVTPAVGDATRATLDVHGGPASSAPTDDIDDVTSAADAGVNVEKTDGGYRVTLPGLPPFVLGGDAAPTIVDVTRTDVSNGGDAPSGSGPSVIDVTRTDVSNGGSTPPSGRPSVAGVTRTDVSNGGSTSASAGPNVVDVTRTDHSTGGARGRKTPNPFEGKVLVRPGKDETTIEVPGFPTITLKPDGKGGITVTLPGTPPFTLPAGTVLEAPGGLDIQR